MIASLNVIILRFFTVRVGHDGCKNGRVGAAYLARRPGISGFLKWALTFLFGVRNQKV